MGSGGVSPSSFIVIHMLLICRNDKITKGMNRAFVANERTSHFS